MLYVVLVVLIMSVITVESLEAIFDKKLAPLRQIIEDVNLSMSLVNEKYEHILKKLSTFEEDIFCSAVRFLFVCIFIFACV